MRVVEVCRVIDVSIHAPVQGATSTTKSSQNALKFQSTLPYRERPQRHCDCRLFRRFQSTLPYRERRSGHTIPVQHLGFNPRSRTGSDRTVLANKESVTRFNPRSRTGSDVPECNASFDRFLFQSTLPYRERLAG